MRNYRVLKLSYFEGHGGVDASSGVRRSFISTGLAPNIVGHIMHNIVTTITPKLTEFQVPIIVFKIDYTSLNAAVLILLSEIN